MKYEFKLEDIISCVIKDLNNAGLFTIKYDRIKNEQNETYSRYFAESFSANPITNEDGTLEIICPKCSRWKTYPADTNADEITDCESCRETHGDVYHENDVRDILLDLVKPGEFDQLEIYINDILIK